MSCACYKCSGGKTIDEEECQLGIVNPPNTSLLPIISTNDGTVITNVPTVTSPIITDRCGLGPLPNINVDTISVNATTPTASDYFNCPLSANAIINPLTSIYNDTKGIVSNDISSLTTDISNGIKRSIITIYFLLFLLGLYVVIVLYVKDIISGLHAFIAVTVMVIIGVIVWLTLPTLNTSLFNQIEKDIADKSGVILQNAANKFIESISKVTGPCNK